MKLAVTTWYHYRNYGTALQATALTSVLRNMGHEPQMIRYKPCGYFRTLPDYSVAAFGKRVYRRIKNRKTAPTGENFCDERKDLLFEDFLNKNIRFTDTCTTKADLERLNDCFDAFICGSDQIWSPLVFNPKYYLDFVHDPKKKIAYAPSIGVETIEDRYVKEEITKLLNRFGSLSVREAAGQKLIKELTGKDSQVVLDPTLLLTAAQWEKLFGPNQQAAEKPYLLVYMLGNNAEHWEAARETAAQLGLTLRLIPVYKNDLTREGCITEPIGPKEFLQLFHDAAYVCTDSFHGMIFALQFHRLFTAFARFLKTDARNQNSRVQHLLSMVGMENRLATSKNWAEIAGEDPDFLLADRILDEQRKKSICYLTEALATAETAQKKNLHVMQQNSLCCGCGACQNVCPVSAIRIEWNQKGFWEAVVDEDKCIHCGKCKAVCPFCTETQSVPAESATLYSFKSSDPDTLLRSTSGGAAYNIARLLLRQGYSVVGCQYNVQEQQAEHVLVDSEEELTALQGSKYIQSNFAQILSQLQGHSKPLAVFGTPCQIAGARRALAKRDDVVYIDLVCHGVPSGHLFEKYREHIKETSGVNTGRMMMSFRYKPKGWSNIHLHAADGEKEYCCGKEDDPFFRMFEVGNCYNETCYECRWRVDSEADVRLGDYWGPKFRSDHTGVNMVVCFTQTGCNIMEQLRSAEVGTVQEQPIEDYLTHQQSLNLPKPVFYDALLAQLQNPASRITDLVDKYAVPLENKNLSREEHLKYIMKMMAYRER